MNRFATPLWAIFLLALFVAAALFGGQSNAVEPSIMGEMAEIRANSPRMTSLVAIITALGGVHVTLGLASLMALLLLLRRAPGRALLLGSTVAVERLMVEGLKDWIGRSRPSIGVDWLPQGLAYPSGHAANSMTAFLAVALIAVPPVHRRPAVVAALVLTFLIGLSRVWLGVHWPSDVIGGWTLGLLAVGTALAIGERSRLLHFELQHEVVGRHRPAPDEDKAA